MVAVTVSAILLYFFLLAVEVALLPLVATRSHGTWGAAAAGLLYGAPILILIGPLYAWKRRVEGVSYGAAWRFAGLSWLSGAAFFGLAVGCVHLAASAA